MARRWGMANYVYRRGATGTYEVRYPIPESLQVLFPKPKGKGNLTHWIESLGTKDRSVANKSGEVVAVCLRTYADWLSGRGEDAFKDVLRARFQATKDYLLAIHSNLKKGNSLAQQLASEGLSREKAFELTLRMSGQRLAMPGEETLPQWPTTSEVMTVMAELRDPATREYVDQAYAFLKDILASLGLRPPILNPQSDGILMLISMCGATLRNIVGFELALRTETDSEFVPDVEFLHQPFQPILQEQSAPKPASEPPQIVIDASPTLGEFFATYEVMATSVARPVERRTIEKRRAAWSAFSSWLGKEKRIGSLTKRDIWDFHDALVDAPRSAGSRSDLKDKTFKELVELGRKDRGAFPRRSQQTIQSQLSQVRTVLELAVTRGLIDSNPATGVSATGGEQSSGVRAFTIEELNQLFSHPVFVDTPASIRDDEFWVPLLQLYTGCRLSELAMPLEHVITEGGEPPYLRIAPTEQRRIKNDGSQRIIPIHPDLKRLGFLEYVATQRERNETMLFPLWVKPHRRRGEGTYDQSPRRRRFNKTILKEAGIDAPDVSARSFRKNFEQLITEGGVPDRIALRLQGRKMGTSADHYLPKELSPTRLSEHLIPCVFDGLKIDHLFI